MILNFINKKNTTMKNQTTRWIFIVVLLFSIGSWGCDDDDKTWDADSDPELSLSTEKIHSEQGRTINIKGTIKDDLGIKSINININEWFLDKDIQIFSADSLVKNYNLDYSFLIPKDAEDKESIIKVTVYNIGDRSTSQDIKVYMDGDFKKPGMDIKKPVDGLTLAPEEEIPLDISVNLSDERQLGYFIIEESNLEFKDSISFMGRGLRTASYTKTIILPATVGEYKFSFMLADSAGNTITKEHNVKASYDFDKLYLADVSNDAELVSDLFGVPMLINKVKPYNFEGKYYAETPGTKIRFIPQTSSFNPHCYGIDPNNANKLINNPHEAIPIVLDEVGYYLITVDLENLTYNVESYVPTNEYFMPKMDQPNDDSYIESTYFGKLGLVGKGFPEYPDQDWTTWASIPFDRDPENNYRFYKTIDLEGEVEFIFQPEHPWGWWPEPFWRFDRSTDPERNVANGGENFKANVLDRTTYKIIFDSHLNRSKAILIE